MKNMKKTRISLFLVIILGFTAIPFSLFAINVTGSTTSLPNYEPVDWQSGLAGDVAMPELGVQSQERSSSGLRTSVTPGVGEVVYDWYLEALGYDPHMTLRAEREFVQVYVANDLSFPEGDPRNDDPLNLLITDEMCGYLADEFNNIIYATDSGYFGESADRYGNDTAFEYYGYPDYYWNWIDTDNGQKVILKVMNIQDDNYDDPTYPSYVVGFFSPTYTDYYNRNMIHIDAWRWWQRLGDEGRQWTPDPSMVVTRPNLYESTVAHEYQHNIHGDQLPGDATYMNEASSLFAEPLCGYELDAGQIEWFLATPDNSLTQWGDQGDINILADYGAAFLWSLYLTDHYGFNFMGAYTQGGMVGTEGINALLGPFGKDFNEVFHDWRIANLVQAKYGKYGYQLDELQAINPNAVLNFDELEPLNVHEINARQFNWKSASALFGETMAGTTAEGDTQYPTGVYDVGAYGSDYIKFTNLKGLETFYIDGQDDVATEGWTYDETGMYWYSGADDLLNTLIATEVYVDPTDPYLTLTTYWDMEDYWDFGFVQVSTDGKWDSDWVSLSNANTTYLHDSAAISTVVDNLPGITVWSQDVVDITFDMSAYAGENVYLGFRYVTDWATFYEGWYLFNVIVSGQEYVSSLNHVYPEVDFMVTVIEQFHGFTTVRDMWFINDATELGLIFMAAGWKMDIYVIVSPLVDLGSADYNFKVSKFHFFQGRHHFNEHCCFC
jgi:immune inhibitor A